MSDDEVWLFEALELASDANAVARISEILDEVYARGGLPGEVPMRIDAELGDGSPERARALALVVRWISVREASAAAREGSEFFFLADHSRRLASALSTAGAKTVGDLDETTLDRVLAEAAEAAGISVEGARSILENALLPPGAPGPQDE